MRMKPRCGWVLVGAVAFLASGCSGSPSGAPPASSSTAPAAGGTTRGTANEAATATTAKAVRHTARITGEHEVNGGYRQGLARGEAGDWVFSTNDGLHRTDASFVDSTAPNGKANPAIPADLKQQGYNHIGDIDIGGGVLWAPIEKEDKASGEQVMATYDPDTLQFRQSFVVKQHHNSFVTVSADNIVYSTDEFSDDTLVRYRYNGSTLEKTDSLKMSKKVDNIQGGDIADGAIWLSTDDDNDGLYRVDLVTGAVQDLGSMGHADGEGEGIDAQPGNPGAVTLAVLSIDAKLLPVRVIDVSVTPSPG